METPDAAIDKPANAPLSETILSTPTSIFGGVLTQIVGAVLYVVGFQGFTTEGVGDLPLLSVIGIAAIAVGLVWTLIGLFRLTKGLTLVLSARLKEMETASTDSVRSA